MDLQAEYGNRARVHEHPAIIAGWARDAAAFRAAWPDADLGLPYGPGERERLDLFRPGSGEAWPAALFLHGGYWQALDRSFFSHMARGRRPAAPAHRRRRAADPGGGALRRRAPRRHAGGDGDGGLAGARPGAALGPSSSAQRS
jgi:hypothetical protein